MFPPRRFLLLFPLSLIFLSPSSHAQSAYGEQPLRGNLHDHPYTHTALGRESHRFAGHSVNRFRIYDFYRRQALWHLEHPEFTQPLLLPFTGLDGGRLGHWGVTNEPSTLALQRTVAPLFPTHLARGEFGLHYLGAPSRKGLVVYNFLLPGIDRILPDGALVSPPGMFRGPVDLWGFQIGASGDSWPRNASPELSTSAGPLSYRGHGIHGDRTIYQLAHPQGQLLDSPLLLNLDATPVLHRTFSFSAPLDSLSIPCPGGPGATHLGEGVFTDPQTGIHHFLRPRGKLAFRLDGKQDAFLIEKISKDSTLEIFSWRDPAHPADLLLPVLRLQAAPDLGNLLRGGPARFPEVLTLQGKTDADPSMAGSGYALDDIPVPFENPWNAPMTLSGVTFTPEGDAFVCTMVGDVWKVTGLDRDLRNVRWKRYAAGLNLPMGILHLDGRLYVSCRKQVVELVDHNRDDEADRFIPCHEGEIPVAAENGGDLQADARGDLYVNRNLGIFRIRPGQGKPELVGPGSRNPFGLAVRADGLVLSDSSEGDHHNGTCTIFEADHPENARSTSKRKRLLYLPRGIDNSPGSRRFLDDDRFGPLGQDLVGVSFGSSTWYRLLRDPGTDTPQAALVPMPGEFSSGAMRLSPNPADGQLYVVGLDGWGDYAVREGCFHRLRFTGKPAAPTLTGWRAHRNGILLHFDSLPDFESLPVERLFAQQWNVRDSRTTYGSPDYSVREPGEIGHDRLSIRPPHRLPGTSSLFIGIPDLRPAMMTQLFIDAPLPGNRRLRLDLYATFNHLQPDHPAAPASDPAKPDRLQLPDFESNGSTYELITARFDRLSGRHAIERPLTQPLEWKPEDLRYGWIRDRILTPNCSPCHQTGSPHDLSHYQGVLSKIRPGDPARSHLLGLAQTRSMPPSGLPALHPSAIEAIETWIRQGAPE